MDELESTINVHLPEFGILVQSRVTRPGFANAAHGHDHPSMLFVVAGQGQIEYRGGVFDLAPHSVVMLPRHLPHRLVDRPRKQMTVFSIYFDINKAELNKSVTHYMPDLEQPLLLPLYYAEQIRRNLRQMLYEQTSRPPGFKIALRQTLNLTMLLIYRAALEARTKQSQDAHPDSTARVQGVLNYTAGNYYEQISLPDAARLAGVSQRQFSTLCKVLSGRSFVQFLNQIRIDKAKELLAATESPVSAIAFKVGYEDLSTFYRAFKKYQQCSPMSVRVQ